jgi:hypothetical protein
MKSPTVRTWILAASVALGSVAVAANTTTWNFDKDAPHKHPAGFTFGLTAKAGKPGRWVVEAVKDAPSGGRALAQLDADPTDARYPLAVATEPVLKDLRVSVKCKMVSGEVDQACGLMFRYKDENNYYITRANVLEDNVRLYSVKDGKRKQFASWDGKVAPKAWHTLEVEAKGDQLRVSWNGKAVIEAKDATFGEAGKVGVWTKADSVTYFDDLAVMPL